MLSIMALFLATTTPLVTETDPLRMEQAIATAFEARFHMTTLPFAAKPPLVAINTTPMLSYYDGEAVHEARFAELPDPIKALFSQWASDAGDSASGRALFEDMFYRFFFVHEMGHWAVGETLGHRQDARVQAAIASVQSNHWQAELVANRIAVAWWREQDPAYLAKLIGDFQKIIAALPNPVPVGQDMQAYFAANYEKLGKDPKVYGWFLLRSVVLAYDEPPKTFQQVIDGLPSQDFD